MMKKLLFVILLPVSLVLRAQEPQTGQKELPAKWEELTAPEFITAVEKSMKTCIIPLGILEKHAAHLPLGTDLISVRETVLRAAEKEYVIIFPAFYFGQIYEARHQPGTVSYSPKTVLGILEETCDELNRNGIEKIILVNGHGGNNSLLPYFCQLQLEKQKNYAVYLFRPVESDEYSARLESMRETDWDGHAGETETSLMLAVRPDLVHMDRAGEQSGKDLDRVKDLSFAYTGIWWYASFPNHYAGDGSYGKLEMGQLILDNEVSQLTEMIRSVKADQQTLQLQHRFYREAGKPLDTEQ